MAAFMRGVSHEILISVGRSTLFRKAAPTAIDSRRYVRALRRRPVSVVYPDGQRETLRKPYQILDSESKQSKHQPSTLQTERQTAGKDIFKKHAPQKASTKHGDNAAITGEHLSQFTDEPGSLKEKLSGLRIEKALPGDKKLGKVVSIARSRTYREQQGKILLEGRRLICDALNAGAIPQIVFFSKAERLCELPIEKLKRASLVKVKFEDIKIWSDLVTPQGVIAIFSKPDTSRLEFPKDLRLQTVPLSLICDNIRDPGNLGTILRCAAAAGCDRVLLTKGCVDAWEPKVLRAAMGAHFRLPIFPSLSWDDIPEHLPAAVTVHVADNCSSSQRAEETETPSKRVLKPSDLGWVSNRPNSKQRHFEEMDSDSDDEFDDSDVEDNVSKFSFPRVEPKLYLESWIQKNTALVIGGETHGLSLEALQLAEKTDGRRLFVPVALGMDSLNSAMAASILLFEGRRQLLSPGRREKSKIH
ncbi:rRNA methyltransferase 3A, mitochondrial [Chanos chanos]|uniref:rRNA methyltransferase 3A, mitochondrial n=1 Tax=Chanos chanos TaxID=29144 RepID=A0A6J2VRX0_CHACN|nr:rRNA methyltransferase 3, mitochondrial [Chanos chanos]